MVAAGLKLRSTSQAKSKALRQLVRKRRSKPLKAGCGRRQMPYSRSARA